MWFIHQELLEDRVMRSGCRAMLALGLAVLLARPALAQQGRGQVGLSFWGRTGLLLNKSVQEELKLTADQIQKIRDVPQSVCDKHQEQRDAIAKLQGKERREKEARLSGTIDQETNMGQQEILNPQQKKRFQEIALQQRGARAFFDKEVQKALKLTDEQKDKIKTINQEANKEIRAISRPGVVPTPGGPQDLLNKMAALRKDSVDKVLAILTDDQKKKYNEMAGATFEVKINRAPPPGQEKDRNNKPAPNVPERG
jgi:Spy/CpxP family protein refolding chaperone